MSELRPYPHAAGDRVWLDGVLRTVTGLPGPYSVQLDGRLTASVSLLRAESDGAENKVQQVGLQAG
jgi:hypothetical protein